MPNCKKKLDFEKYNKTVAIKEAKQKSWEKFDLKWQNYRENQKLFNGTLKQFKNKEKYNKNDKDGNIVTEQVKIKNEKNTLKKITREEIKHHHKEKENEARDQLKPIEELEIKKVIKKKNKWINKKLEKSVTLEIIKYISKEEKNKLAKQMIKKCNFLEDCEIIFVNVNYKERT